VPVSASVIDSMLSTWAGDAPWMSVHSAYSATGGSELSGGSYARVNVTWGSPSAESVSLSGAPYTVNIPSSGTAAFTGFWSASSGGTFAGMFPCGNFTAYTFAAVASSSTFTAPGSSFSNATTVVMFATAGSALPGGFTAGTVYYVITASSDSFQLSATSGGSAVTVTADGSGIVQQIASQAFLTAGTLSVTGCTVSGT
jgi:hypothetical protein